ncbi:MAG TPA: alpha/beta hydrolase [Fimbriimonadaceae bacterium]|nr:alpha/beta hydrolase [Fimbriimonadaceae bacterium]
MIVSLAALLLPVIASSLGNATDSTFDSNGVKIRYVTEGKGEAVVLIHGWMGDSSMWGRDAAGNTKLVPVEGFQVIALDCRGHGKSDKPHDPTKYGDEMAADVIRLLDHLKIKRAHLIGYSMGTFIAGRVSATHPNRVISLIFGGQAPLLTGEAGSKEIDAFAKAVQDGKGLAPYLLHVRPELSEKAATALAKILYDGKDVKAWALAGQSFKGLEVRAEDLKKCDVPTLFVYGSKEHDSTKTRIAILRKVLDKSVEKVVEGGDHITTLTKPAFGKAIVEFLVAQKSK